MPVGIRSTAERVTASAWAGTISREAQATNCRSFHGKPVADIFAKPTDAIKHPPW
jgi:hypothetical protein